MLISIVKKNKAESDNKEIPISPSVVREILYDKRAFHLFSTYRQFMEVPAMDQAVF